MSSRPSIGFIELHVQLKITNMLVAAQLKERVKQKDLVRLLMNTGASDQDLADILSTTPGTIAVTKKRIRSEMRIGKLGSQVAGVDGGSADLK